MGAGEGSLNVANWGAKLPSRRNLRRMGRLRTGGRSSPNRTSRSTGENILTAPTESDSVNNLKQLKR